MNKTKSITEQLFFKDESIAWDIQSDTVKRKIMVYDNNMMLVKVAFKQGGIGEVHAHPHTQMTYVEEGVFEVEVAGRKQILRSGDTFYIPSNHPHGVKCLEEGVLIDIFHPTREDFIV